MTPSGPQGFSAYSAFLKMRRNRLEFIRTMTHRYGSVSCLSIGGRHLVLVSSKSGIARVLKQEVSNYKKGMGFSGGKEFFGDGLVTSEANTWRKQRTGMNPFFRQPAFSVWSSPIKKSISDCIGSIEERSKSGHVVNLEQCIGNLTCNILSCTIIGAPLDARSLRHALLTVDAYANKKMTGILPEPPLSHFRYKRAIRYIEKVTQAVIEHNRSQSNSTSLVSFLLSSDQEDILNIHDQTASFLMAGQDNTTSLICWSLLLLAANPGVQDDFRNSISRNPVGDDLSPRIIEDQRYACAVMFEAMRLFPPVWAIPRRPLVDVEIDGYFVSRESEVLLLPFLLHRSAEDWKEPEKFSPSRFLESKSLTMLSLLGHLQKENLFVPFGVGPRACIGFQHALVVSIAVVTALIGRFKVSLLSDRALPAAMPRLSLRPHPSASLRFTPAAN